MAMSDIKGLLNMTPNTIKDSILGFNVFLRFEFLVLFCLIHHPPSNRLCHSALFCRYCDAVFCLLYCIVCLLPAL